METTKIKAEFREYKGFRYAIDICYDWVYGHLLIDEQLFKDLGLGRFINYTSSSDGKIRWVQHMTSTEIDIDFEGQKENEIYFTISTRNYRFSGDDKYISHVDGIMKEWIDWIVDNMNKCN